MDFNLLRISFTTHKLFVYKEGFYENSHEMTHILETREDFQTIQFK